MLMTILNVLYVLIAVAMIVLILMQRGAGAQAGSGFGAGASATVFGSRGAGNFLSKSTKWLAISFFAISLFMGWNATHNLRPKAAQPTGQDLGLMSDGPAAPAAQAPAATAPTGGAVPAAPAANNAAVPAAPAANTAVPTAPASSSTSSQNK
ncbi:MAG: preprotein translocase subunit SecG [Lysobacter sp.]|nr:preprotein translocase subunit SecG [Lysobacter sp.]